MKTRNMDSMDQKRTREEGHQGQRAEARGETGEF